MDIWKIIRIIRNIALVILGLMIILALVVFFAPQAYMAVDTKVSYLVNKQSGMYEMPIIRDIENASDKFNKFERVSRFGLKFSAPWTNMQTVKEGNATLELKFDNNKVLRLVYYEGGFKLVEDLKAKNPNVYKIMVDVDGQKNFESEFAFCKYYLESSPQKLSIFSSNSRVTTETTLLSIKKYLIRNAGKGLFIYNNDRIKAIQYGKPNMGKGEIWIDIFDNKNNRYSMALPSDNVTQDEIDYILDSIEFE